ncbi:ribosome small subunit-dependent GTPase A [bacterium]|nr:ribosome small subunit-dependent GTPase A [bacterium]
MDPGPYGRVASQARDAYSLLTENGEVEARLSGKLRFDAEAKEALHPAVGDWVRLSWHNDGTSALIHEVLPRTSKFSRNAAGKGVHEQIVATNVDVVFLVNALNLDFNLRRIERYLALAWESGATPVVLLTKADLCDDVEARCEAVRAIAPGVPVHALSASAGTGLEALDTYLRPGKTVALLGSSGAGKSTLFNRLLGSDRQQVQAVRDGDDRGRHTTTRRELVLLPSGALALDTPGMRELQLWEGGDGIQETFAEIAAFAARCRFRDCRHDAEPGCAVRTALEAGVLDAERLASFRKLEREAAYQLAKVDANAERSRKQRIKELTSHLKRHYEGRER